MISSVRMYDLELCDCGFYDFFPNDLCTVSHGFWVIFSLVLFAGIFVALCIWELQTTVFFGVMQMGGKRQRVEPGSCMEWMKKDEVWEILSRGNFTGYMEKLNGGNPTITQQFLKSWKEGSIMVGNQRMEVTEEVIAEATGLELEGLNFYREHKLSDRAVDDFVDSEIEKARLVKIGKSFVNPASISRPWRFVMFVIMEYLTLDGRFTKFYGYHFMLANHFRRNVKINFPYYLK